MPEVPEPVRGRTSGVEWVLRPEWLAGSYWWRVLVAGHPKLLLRHREHAMRVAETVADDEAHHRREATGDTAP